MNSSFKVWRPTGKFDLDFISTSVLVDSLLTLFGAAGWMSLASNCSTMRDLNSKFQSELVIVDSPVVLYIPQHFKSSLIEAIRRDGMKV